MMNWLIIAFRWLLSTAKIKYVITAILTVLFTYSFSQLTPLMAGYTSPDSLYTSFASLHPSIWYFLNLLNIAYGVRMIIGAYISRFHIRSIPLIG
jgi:hypothetical protein